MHYAKVDSEGNIIEFPYRVLDLRNQTEELPEDVVEVDTATNRPDTNWDEVLQYGEIDVVDGNYVLSYNVVDRFARFETEEEKQEQRLKTITSIVRTKGTQARRKFDSSVSNLKSDYPESEAESWAEQLRQAKLVLSESTEETPLIDAMAEARGITADDLANRIVTKADEYQAEYGALLGEYQRVTDVLETIDLDDPTTWDLVNSIVK